MGSGLPFPIPWSLFLTNIYLNFRIIYSTVYVPAIVAKQKILKSKGLQKPADYMGVYRPDVPWLTQTLPGAHISVNIIPRNVTLTGPINLAGVEPAGSEGAEIYSWLERAPTLLISLGSAFTYSRKQAVAMAEAIKAVLGQTNVQVLWKMEIYDASDKDFLNELVKEQAGRLRIEKWIEVQPPTLLQSGHIVASVHHGGAGCFHDALA